MLLKSLKVKTPKIFELPEDGVDKHQNTSEFQLKSD